MKKNSFVEGTVIATVAVILVKIIGMLYVIPFYNIVGSEGGALYSYAYNIYLIFLGISSAGLPNAISKIITEYNTLGDENAKNRAYTLGKKIVKILALITFVILFAFAEVIGAFIIGDIKGGNTADDIAFVIRCVSFAVLVIPFLSITKGYLQGHKYVTPASTSQLIEQVVRVAVILIGSFLILKVFDGSMKFAIGLAVSGAFFGGLAGYLYLKNILRKHKDELNIKDNKCEDKKLDKEIIKKILTYAVPFIIINIVTNIYNFTDQILVLRTLEYLKFETVDIEFIASAISTWSPKICMIVNAMAMGMTVSLIPTIVSAYTKKDKREVENKINKSVGMMFYISLPLVLGLAVLAPSVWTVFFNENVYGGMILRLAVFSALLANIYMVLSTILQSLNKFKTVYLVSITGFVLNTLLDVPIMLLFNYIGLPAFLGSIVASICGFGSSVLIALLSLKKQDGVSYRLLRDMGWKSLVSGLAMVIVLIPVNMLLPFNPYTLSGAFINIFINVIIGAPIYLGLSYKFGLIDEIFGKDIVKKILKKLTRGKLGN